MKKFNSIFALLVAVLLTSCSNDDIPMESEVTFKLNPATVVENLYEYSAGDLTSIDSDDILNVCLFIYDESGNLVAKDIQEAKSYANVKNSNLVLASGNYTAVAITYVSTTVEYWDFTGVEKLSTLKITDNGYIGSKWKMLGLTVQDVSIASAGTVINIDIKNAGSVVCVEYNNWNRYNNVMQFGLLSNKTSDYISAGNDKNINYSLRTKDYYGFWLSNMDYDSDWSGGYDYYFTFPMKSVSMTFAAVTTDEEWYLLGTEMIADIELGKTYHFMCDVSTNEAEWYVVNYDQSIHNGDVEMAKDKLAAGMKNGSSVKKAVYDSENMSIMIK